MLLSIIRQNQKLAAKMCIRDRVNIYGMISRLSQLMQNTYTTSALCRSCKYRIAEIHLIYRSEEHTSELQSQR